MSGVLPVGSVRLGRDARRGGYDRLYEFACTADDQGALDDGRKFADSFEPTI